MFPPSYSDHYDLECLVMLPDQGKPHQSQSRPSQDQAHALGLQYNAHRYQALASHHYQGRSYRGSPLHALAHDYEQSLVLRSPYVARGYDHPAEHTPHRSPRRSRGSHHRRV